MSKPKTRSDCVNGPRPCPWVSCRYHLMIDYVRANGDLKLAFETLDEMKFTCTLDIVDKYPDGIKDCELIGSFVNKSRSRIDTILDNAISNMRKNYE